MSLTLPRSLEELAELECLLRLLKALRLGLAFEDGEVILSRSSSSSAGIGAFPKPHILPRRMVCRRLRDAERSVVRQSWLIPNLQQKN